MKRLLHTDPELIRLSIPISQEEMKKLESNLIENGCLEPIVIWNGVILDGHKRYRICVEENIDFEINDMKFEDINEATIWICSHRISQYSRKSTPYQYLIGKWYAIQKLVNYEKRKRSGYISFSREYVKKTDETYYHYGHTSISMGKELGMNRSTIEKYRRLSESMDRIDMIEPKLFQAILSGDVEFSQNEIIRMMRYDNKTISMLRHEFVDRKDVKMRAYGNRKHRNKVVNSNEEGNNEITLTMGIKQMPKFDPDMSLRGLTLTIPMWISAMERAQQQTDMSIATEDAKLQLGEMLIRLDDKIQDVLEVL
ncbi:hypothetical protein SAMN02910353_02833 [Ruminococcus sp. YRD2003]|uniref:hypothetical protein n=1 Tax=Ruminococcus sp. YRD2003 TaxID=1452313 RepID=UPI0008ACCA2A|nr:hypothetical protein SAMN02910353_02833 [Ruminococcus flavefaciens]